MLTHETGTGTAAGLGRLGMDHDHAEEHEDERDVDGPSASSSTASRLTSPVKPDDYGGTGGAIRDRDAGEQRRQACANAANPHSDDISDPELGEGDSGEKVPSGQSRKKGSLQLQDQTNLLPVRQVITVFIGLSMALFCSLLDQTM